MYHDAMFDVHTFVYVVFMGNTFFIYKCNYLIVKANCNASIYHDKCGENKLQALTKTVVTYGQLELRS